MSKIPGLVVRTAVKFAVASLIIAALNRLDDLLARRAPRDDVTLLIL